MIAMKLVVLSIVRFDGHMLALTWEFGCGLRSIPFSLVMTLDERLMSDRAGAGIWLQIYHLMNSGFIFNSCLLLVFFVNLSTCCSILRRSSAHGCR
jgi:hypothetical protein